MEYMGCRVTCKDCSAFKDGQCVTLPNEIKISASNNVCKLFKNRIINPSMPPFDFDSYLYWLANDFYRPYTIDPEKTIIGSAKLGELIMDNGRTAELLPTIYQPFYKMIDLPRCRSNFPKCNIEINGYKFTIHYHLFRNQTFLEAGKIKFLSRYWKKTPKARKYTTEYNGTYEMEKAGI